MLMLLLRGLKGEGDERKEVTETENCSAASQSLTSS
jgi:hypothetical protein